MELKKSSHMFGSECDLKMHVQNLGYPLLLKTETQNLSMFNIFEDSKSPPNYSKIL